jgi:opacity protein-like surface antigen
MVGLRLGLSPLAALVTLTAVTAARAADYPQPTPQPVIIQRPVVQEFSGWYLRGDIGFSNQHVDSLFNANYDNFDSVQNVDKDFDSAPFFGLGIGYYVNDWLRFDVTGEYRGKANFHGFDIGAIPGGGSADDRYTASKSEWTFLFNGYVDLGTWNKLTPFVGAGVGVSRKTISNFGDFSTCTNSNSCAGSGGSDAYADSASKWSFAWALYAGLAYRLTRNVAIEFAYRYIDLGDAQSGDLIAFDGTNNLDNPMEFHHLTSHDFKLGLRVNLDGFNDYRPVQYYAPPPVYAPPPPAYEPPPPPPPPPLRSRG